MPLTFTKGSKKSLDFQMLATQLLYYVYNFFWLVIILAVALVLFMAYQFFLLPKYASVVSNKEIIAKQELYSQQQQYYKELTVLKKSYEIIRQADKDKVNSIIESGSDQALLFREMQYIVRKNGLTLDGLQSLPLDKTFQLPNIAAYSKPNPLLAQVQLVRTTCDLSNVSYEGLRQVLATMEVNLRLMDVEKVDYDPATKKAKLSFITYQF